MSTLIVKKINRVLVLNMVIIGMVIGFSLFATYALPVPEESGGLQEGYFTFQSTCTACHEVTSVENYQGSSSWQEIIELMKGYGAFMQEEEEQEILQYLEETYPR